MSGSAAAHLLKAEGANVTVLDSAEEKNLLKSTIDNLRAQGVRVICGHAAEGDSGIAVPRLRVDGGMSANPTFVQALADAGQRIVEVSPVIEATTLGAAFLAGLAVGTWRGEGEVAATWSPRQRVEPQRKLDRDRWREACRRAARWIPDLSAVDF